MPRRYPGGRELSGDAPARWTGGRRQIVVSALASRTAVAESGSMSASRALS